MTPPACVLITPIFQKGDPAPEGYLAWHEWAAVQHRAGLRQRPCRYCGLWRFPQELTNGRCHGCPDLGPDTSFTVDDVLAGRKPWPKGFKP